MSPWWVMRARVAAASPEARATAPALRRGAGSTARFVALSAALVACDDAAVPVPAAGGAPGDGSAWQGELSAELRGFADVSLAAAGDESVAVQLTLREVATDGLLDPARPLVATGRRERFPEAGSELWVATFADVTASACPGGTATLALSLHRRPPDARFGGGLTAYCGAEARGVPARVFRLSGTLSPR